MNYMHCRSGVLVAIVLSISGIVCTSNQVSAQEENPPVAASDPADKLADELIAQSKALSVSTTRDGEGWEAYASFLHEAFSRWSTNSEVRDRETTVEMIRKWWEEGNRQSASEEEIISVQISGTTGVVRKKIHENYVDAEGKDAGEFSGYVTQTWVGGPEAWTLLSVTIQIEQ